MLTNPVAGVLTVDGIPLRAARNVGAMPYILAGMRIDIGTSFIVGIGAEMIAVDDGLGFRILEARNSWSDPIIAGMLTVGLLGLRSTS